MYSGGLCTSQMVFDSVDDVGPPKFYFVRTENAEWPDTTGRSSMPAPDTLD